MQESTPDASGDNRGGDRREQDRRRTDRRSPAPVWRRPWALVAYGVLGALLLVLLFNGLGDDPPAPDPATVAAVRRPVAAPDPGASAPAGAIEDGLRAADIERLIAEGETATGRAVRVQLFCDAISSVALRQVDNIRASVAALSDAEGRVPAAECKWGEAGEDVRRGDLLLLVPPGLAERFASAPLTEDGFVSRRRIEGVIEWIGRSGALSLRTVGILGSLSG